MMFGVLKMTLGRSRISFLGKSANGCLLATPPVNKNPSPSTKQKPFTLPRPLETIDTHFPCALYLPNSNIREALLSAHKAIREANQAGSRLPTGAVKQGASEYGGHFVVTPQG